MFCFDTFTYCDKKKKKLYELLIDCLFVPINCDTSVFIKVVCVDNTSNQLFRHHFVL